MTDLSLANLPMPSPAVPGAAPACPSTGASTVLVLGARGRFGGAAVRAFSRAGWKVLAQVREGAAMPDIVGVTWVHAGVNDAAGLARRADGASVVVHGLSPAYTHKAWAAQAPAMLECAIGVSRALGATLMLPGNVYNFGECLPAVLTEDTPQIGAGPMARVRIALERRLEAAVREGGLRAVVLRAGDFFGSGRGSWLDLAMAKDLRRGRVSLPGARDIATPWAYLPDLARAFVGVAERRGQLPAFEVLHFAGHTVTGDQWSQALGDVARRQGWLPDTGSVRVSATPWPVLRLLGLFVPTLAALTHMRYLWRTPHRLDNRRLCALIGEEPRTPFGEAVSTAVGDLGGPMSAAAHPPTSGAGQTRRDSVHQGEQAAQGVGHSGRADLGPAA